MKDKHSTTGVSILGSVIAVLGLQSESFPNYQFSINFPEQMGKKACIYTTKTSEKNANWGFV